MSEVPHNIPVDRDCHLAVVLQNNGAFNKEQLEILVNHFDDDLYVYFRNNFCLVTNYTSEYACTTCKNMTDFFEISDNTLYTKYNGSNDCSIRTCCSCEIQCFSEYFQQKGRMPCTTYDVKKQTFVSENNLFSKEDIFNKRQNKNEKPGPLVDQARPRVKRLSFNNITYTKLTRKVNLSQLMPEDNIIDNERQSYSQFHLVKTKNNFNGSCKNKCIEYRQEKRQMSCTTYDVKKQEFESHHKPISIEDIFNKRQNKNIKPGPLVDQVRPRVKPVFFVKMMTKDKNMNERQLYSKDSSEKAQTPFHRDTPKGIDQTTMTDEDCVRKPVASFKLYSDRSPSFRPINSLRRELSKLSRQPVSLPRIRNKMKSYIQVLPASPLTVSVSKDVSVFQRVKEDILVYSFMPLNNVDYKLPTESGRYHLPIQATDGPHENVEQDSAPAPTLRTHLSFNTTRQSERLNCRYPEFADQSRRVASFVHWPHRTDSSSMDTGKMADSGLYFTGPFDLVRCYSCGLGMKDWAPGDDCLLEHIRFSPRCEHLITTTDPDILQSYRARVEQRNHQQARHPHYASREARLGSFETWSNNGHQTPEELTDAGFFYTGQEDRTRCYYCDGGLQHWDEGDEPWIEHARWFPSCEHVRRTKGELFIETIQATLRSFEEDETEGATGYIETDMAALHINGTGKESEDPIYNPMAQNVITLFGFSQAAVRIAIQECAEQGRRWNTEILANILYDKQERGEVLPVDSPRPSSPAQPPIDINTDDGLLAEHRRLLNIVMCIQCEDNEANILFLPCAHRRFCSECARDVTMCPICTKPVKEKVRTYMA